MQAYPTATPRRRVCDEADWVPAGGVGLRWRLTRQNRLNFRIDYALGRDDDSLIISVGEAFRGPGTPVI
jgi:hypothetical protein